MTINFGLKLFEIETILSVEARGDIDWESIKANSINLHKFGNMAFETEGIKAVAPKQMKKASVDPKYMIK